MPEKQKKTIRELTLMLMYLTGPLQLKIPRFHQWTNSFCSYPLLIAVQGGA